MSEQEIDLIQGTLTVLILRTLSWGPMNGYAIGRWIRDTTDGAIKVEEGALYPALHRMEHRGWIEAEWGTTENGRRARFYSLTSLGRRQLRARVQGWERLVTAMTKALRASPRPT
ncbi:MAG TPA: PadR family transcriptional regulator [Gemmatimonadaceae bacterium]|nr:PadR family transcriptional regulator [Gemmatimonadaceae bacterium]